MWSAMSNRCLVKLRRFRGLKQLKVCAYSGKNAYSTSPAIVETQEDLYPEVKPLYPPGKWGSMPRKVAWKFYQEGVELNKIPHLKHRLEALAGEVFHPFYNVYLVDSRPNIPYKLFVTKTHVEDGLPDLYNTLTNELDSNYDRLKSEVLESLVRAHEQYLLRMRRDFKPFTTTYIAKQTLKAVFDTLITSLAAEKEHFLRAQIDEDVPVETFWLKAGYKDIIKAGSLHFTKALRLRTTYNATMQIRTEQPLPQFVERDAEISSGDYQQYPYHPRSLVQAYSYVRPKTVSGHWIDDPCEFAHTVICGVDERWSSFKTLHGEDLANKETLAMAVLAGFGSTVSQAHNQGFNMYWDVTYPFTTQVVISDGQFIRLGTYQLNTLQLAKDDSANELRNILWTTDCEKLYDVIEDGQVKGFNDNVCKNLIKFMLLVPGNRGVNLRPHLPDHPSPLERKVLINNVGDEPFEHKKFERFDLPRNAIYDSMDS